MIFVVGKKRFDSFRRTTPITFSVAGREHAPIETTIAQLWWGKWIYVNHIMAHIKSNWPDVRRDMAVTLKRQRTRKKHGLGRPKKRRRMFKQQVHMDNIVLRWDT